MPPQSLLGLSQFPLLPNTVHILSEQGEPGNEAIINALSERGEPGNEAIINALSEQGEPGNEAIINALSGLPQ